MAINEKLLDELLGDRDPNEVFSKDGLFDDLKKALAERILNATPRKGRAAKAVEKSAHYTGRFICPAPCPRPSLIPICHQMKISDDSMAIPEDDTAWFLAQLKPNSALIAKRNLARQGFQTFLPSHGETARHKGRFVTRDKPLFPGYIFVAFDPGKGGWHAINSTAGITRLVSFGAEPRAVPSGIVASLMQRCDETGKLLPPPVLKAGDSVQLTTGPFADFIATVERIAPDKRVWVLLDLMGQKSRIEIEADRLRLA